MPTYTLNHLHHETRDVDGAVSFYQKVFGATSEAPFERGGATWVRVHVGDVAIMVTNRPCSDNVLGRYQGLDHIGMMTDDFDATIAAIQQAEANIWFGPTKLDTGMRIAFVSGPDNVKIELMEKI